MFTDMWVVDYMDLNQRRFKYN